MSEVDKTSPAARHDDRAARERISPEHSLRLTRRQLLAAGAGAAGVAAGASLIGGSRTAEAAADVVVRGAYTAPASLISLQVTAKTQGALMGDTSKTKKMTAYGYRQELELGYDHTTGSRNGKRQYMAIVVTKPVGPGSPQLLNAAATNETLTSVVIVFSRMVSGKATPYYRITLTNAGIVDCVQYVSDTEAQHFQSFGGLNLLEDVSFTFQKIQVDNLDGPTSFSDDWYFVV